MAKTTKITKISGFLLKLVVFVEKAYLNLEAFADFDSFDTTGTPLDTPIGCGERTDQNPYLNPEEKSKMCQKCQNFH